MVNSDEIEDILYYAINKEVEANVFYNLLSQYIDDAGVRDICNELASEELEHKARLELEIMKLGMVVKPSVADQQGNKVLPKPLDYMVEITRAIRLGLPELMLWAMEKEKMSFRLYIDMIDMVEEKESRQTLMELAEEEARHKMRFEVEYDKLLAGHQGPPV
jgi:rubrerythrin